MVQGLLVWDLGSLLRVEGSCGLGFSDHAGI